MGLEKVKVAYIINSLSSGGAEMMLYRLLERIDRELFEPEVITLLNYEGPLKKKVEELGINVNQVYIRSLFDFVSFYRLYKTIKVIKPHILHTQLFAADILGRMLGRLLKVPVTITSIRNEYYGGKLRDLAIKMTEKYAVRTTFVSCSAARRFIEARVVPDSKALVIYNGIDPALFSPQGVSSEGSEERICQGFTDQELCLLAVGSLTEQKGYPLLFEAFEIIIGRGLNARLLIAGEGPCEGKLKAIVEEQGLSGKVCFLGRSDNIARLMAAADLFVLSSKWEGLPGVVVEAMASGLPVVATAVGGTPELVVEGITGYLVQPEDPCALASALEKATNLTASERKTMGEAGRLRIEKEFHVDKMVESYERLYEESLREKKIID